MCPVCRSTGTQTIYRLDCIPVHSCVLLPSAEAARAFPRRDLELAFCEDCGFIFNHIFDEAVMDYSTEFEESQHFSYTFSSFARSFARDIATRCETRGKRILEIGCGKGEFLVDLCNMGEATGLGIDPAYRSDPGRSPSNGKVAFIAELFDLRHTTLSADIVLCRHTLEHIGPVDRFTRTIREMIGARDDVWVVFETPDVKRVLREGAFWDIYYEHCSYFSPGTHAMLFRLQAFGVVSLDLAYDNQYIIQYALPAGRPTRPSLPLEADLAELRQLAVTFAKRVRTVQDLWRERIGAAHADGKRVMLWGGSSKAVSFLTTLRLGSEVDAVVDINPYRQHKFTPGTGHPIVAPQSLARQPPDIVIVMNPMYLTEVVQTLDTLGLEPEVVAM
jgi:SAM-dependent methyltransferase